MKQDLIAETSVVINASPAAVWKALTTPSLIKQYLMGTDTTSDWKEGSPITYSGEYQGKKYQDKGVIKRIVPEQIFQSTYLSAMSGKEDKPENYNLVTYVLLPKDVKTILTLTQDNNSTEEARTHSLRNWEMVLGKLKEIVEAQ